jgi:hypothetical protein
MNFDDVLLEQLQPANSALPSNAGHSIVVGPSRSNHFSARICSVETGDTRVELRLRPSRRHTSNTKASPSSGVEQRPMMNAGMSAAFDGSRGSVLASNAAIRGSRPSCAAVRSKSACSRTTCADRPRRRCRARS